MTNRRPRPDDAVLGGQFQAPLEEVNQKLVSDRKTAKKEEVLQALEYLGQGIEILFESLEQENNFDVLQLAYQHLEDHIGKLQARLGQYQSKLNQYQSQMARETEIEAIGENLYDEEDWYAHEGATLDPQELEHPPLHEAEDWYEYESVTVNRQGEIIQRTPGRARYYREDLGNGVHLDMVYIAEGSFLMGASANEHKSDDEERPQHRVAVPRFWMGKYQVTQAQWEAVMGSNPSQFKGKNRPVDTVSWNMCQDFCRKLSQRTEKRYRLPSEAEWEYACRAGTTTPYSCGETITKDLANYKIEEGKEWETLEVGSFLANAWGLYDMHGNIEEWCEDKSHDNYQGAPIDGSAWTHTHYPKNLSYVLRGGSFYEAIDRCRSAFRFNGFIPNYGHDFFGLRLVLVLV